MNYKIGRASGVICALTINLCAAAPPAPGGEVRGAAGYGSYSYSSGGCGGPVYRNEAEDLKAHARATYRDPKQPWSVTLEGSVSHSEVKRVERVDEGEGEPTPDALQIGKRRWGYMGAARGGLHWAYGGFEAGPTVFARSVTDPGAAENDPQLLVSAMAWAGVPRYVYAWGSLFEGPGSASFVPISLGLGHSGERFRGTLGVGLAQGLLTGQAEFLLPLEQPIWLGAMAHGGEDNWGGMVMVSVPLMLE